MAHKVTMMVLKVDLQCSCCYKKVKKLLCKFPQIQDQVYDEKENTVTISVVCCSPEKIRDKLICKGGNVIKSIEIKPPINDPKLKEPVEKPKVLPEKPKAPADQKPNKDPEKPKAPSEKPKDLEKPKEPSDQKPKTPAEKPKVSFEKPKTPVGKPTAPGPASKAPKAAPTEPAARTPPRPPPTMPVVTGYGSPSIFPYEACCGPCYQGLAGGPCYHGYGRSEEQPNNYGAYDGGRPMPCDYYYNYPYNNNNYDQGNTSSSSACTLM